VAAALDAYKADTKAQAVATACGVYSSRAKQLALGASGFKQLIRYALSDPHLIGLFEQLRCSYKGPTQAHHHTLQQLDGPKMVALLKELAQTKTVQAARHEWLHYLQCSTDKAFLNSCDVVQPYGRGAKQFPPLIMLDTLANSVAQVFVQKHRMSIKAVDTACFASHAMGASDETVAAMRLGGIANGNAAAALQGARTFMNIDLTVELLSISAENGSAYLNLMIGKLQELMDSVLGPLTLPMANGSPNSADELHHILDNLEASSLALLRRVNSAELRYLKGKECACD
jgi:hypothetical protein